VTAPTGLERAVAKLAPASDSVTDRYGSSVAQVKRAARSLAGGVATAMRASQRPVPLVIERGAGSRVWDIDGNEYIDYVLGFGPLLLGHCPAEIASAVMAQLDRGMTFGAQHELEAELAELIVQTVPCAELVCFSTTGSEAVHAALRIARAATGRPRIVKFEGHYHGWLDPVHVATPGMPAADEDQRSPVAPRPATAGQVPGDDHVLVARWNDPDDLASVLERYGDEVAVVMMEPVACNGGVIAPQPGYLETALELTHRAGALLLFDEVVTGFRLALGGAQERYGVVPDLATYGKAIAAGMPLSAVAGRRDVLELVARGDVPHVGTFNCSPPAAAAATAAIGVYRGGSPGLYQRLEWLASSLAGGLREAAADAGVPLRVHQVGPLLQTFVIDPDDEVTSYADSRRADGEAFGLFAEQMLARGVMVLPRGWWFLSTAHDEHDVEVTIGAAHEAFGVVAASRP
jgi:glutamate-1-semialdehyde 2,1-aminomutase